MSEARKPSLLRRVLAGGAWTTAALVVIASAALSWLVATESGARFVLARVADLTGASVGPVEGRLAGPLAVDSLEIATPKLRVAAKRLALDWSPLRLLGGELRVDRVHAASLEIATAASAEPAREPSTLVPPLRIHVDRAGVERLAIATLGREKDALELRDVSLRVAGDAAAWIVGAAEATTPAGRAKLAGTLGARAPFALDAKGSIEGRRGEAAYRATLEARGRLAAIEATLSGSEGGLAGTARARIEPFAAAPLRSLDGRLENVDLSAFAALPRTRLAVDASLAATDGAVLAGTVAIANAMPGPWDKERLPVASARAALSIAKGRVEATGLQLALAGGGSARGALAWSAGKLDAKLDVREIDLRAVHSALRPTRLAGDIAAEATAQAQSFTLALADPRFSIAGDARVAGGRLTVGKARLARGAAFAELSGELALAGPREFRVAGRLERLDPAAFAAVPAGDLNAGFTASGRLAGGLAGEATLEIARSRFAALALSGRAEAALDGGRLARARADLALGETKLVVSGALRRAGDALDVKLASPDLGPIARAFGITVGGRVDLDARLSGELAALSGRAAFEARNLALPGALTLASGSGQFELGHGEQGRADGRLEIAGLARRGREAPLVSRAVVTVKGTRAAHDIAVDAGFPEQASVRATLAGGVTAGARLPEWRGRLETLVLEGPAALALAAPAPLLVSAERVELGLAVLGGEPGEIRLASTAWTPAGIRTQGSSNAVVIRTIRQVLKVPGEFGSNLLLVGEWDVRVGESVDGFLSLRRERGDVRLGEPRQAMGLEALSLRADANGGRVRATLDIRGRRIGSWNAEASATLRKGDAGWEVSPVAPVAGRFAVDVPDLAWLAAWVGPDARTAGRLRGEGVLEGTAADPSWSGRVELSGLALREPTLGAEVGEGTIVVALKDHEARLERFELATPWRPVEAAARAIAAAKRPEKGTLTAQGSFDLASRKGGFTVRASAFPLTSLPTRFLAVSGEGRAALDGPLTTLTGAFAADAGWFGIPASAPPSLSDDVVIDRGGEAKDAARTPERIRLDLRVDLGDHTQFVGRGLSTRLAGALRLAGDLGPNLRTTGTIRAVGGTYDAYGRTLTLERGALNFQGAVDNPGLNVLALRKGLAVEAGVEVLGTVARPRVRLVSSPDVPDPEKLAWLVLGRGQGDVSAADAATLITAADSILGREAPARQRLIGGLGIDEVSFGSDSASLLGVMPESTVAGRTRAASASDVITVGARLTDDIRLSYQQGLADAEGSLRVAWQYSRSLSFILRAGYREGVDAVYRFSFR